MEKVQLILGAYYSFPVDGHEEVLENYYQVALKPFLTKVYTHPEILLNLYFSGPVLEWLQFNHPEYLLVLLEMIKRKQVEMLGGAYHGPFLPLIPHRDRIDQIEELTVKIRQTFGKRPRGVWLMKGVWESHLASNLDNSGMEYTLLEDRYFQKLELPLEETYCPKITEHQGKTLTVFPYSQTVAKDILSGDYHSFHRVLEERAKLGDSFLGLMLPGTGLPDKQDLRFFENGGLDHLLFLLRDYTHSVETIHPGAYLRKNPRRMEKVYFPNTSLADLERMSLAPPFLDEHQRPQNGEKNYRHILTQHPRSNLLYCKMIYVRILVDQIRGDRSRKKIALDELWKSQSHHYFYHWDEGWKYHYSERHRAYRALISSESLTRMGGSFENSLSAMDFDMDGLKEFLFQGEEYNAYVDSKGGALFEWDYFPGLWNFLDCPDGRRYPQDPAYPKNAFMDHFLGEEGPEDFFGGRWRERGNFLRKEYRLQELNREQKSLVLAVRGEVQTPQGTFGLVLRKSYTFLPQGFRVSYELENTEIRPFHCCFAPESTLVLASEDPDISLLSLGSTQRCDIRLPGQNLLLHYTVSGGASLHHRAHVQGRGGLGSQSTTDHKPDNHSLLALVNLKLEPGIPRSLVFDVEWEALES